MSPVVRTFPYGSSKFKDGGKDHTRRTRKGEKMTKKIAWKLSFMAVAVGFVLSSMGCATMLMKESTADTMIFGIDDSVPAGIADGSYVCSRARILEFIYWFRIHLGGQYYVYKTNKYAIAGTKSVAIRVSGGKVREILAVSQGRGETAQRYATATTFYTVWPIIIPELSALDKVSDFNEAKAMLH